MHATTVTHTHTGHGAGEFHPLKWVGHALAIRKQRQRLDQLDDHLLRDIGIDRRSAYWESHRPFWDRM